jgi:chlorinating enzyme
MITGAGGGIGRALAAGFLEDGALVVALNRSRANRPLEDPRLLTLLGDVTSEADVASAVDAAVTRFGRIDVLVNNAGVSNPGEFGSKPVSEWVEAVQVNLVGAGICTHFVLRQMKSQGYGRVVNIVSREAENPGGFLSGYAASKAGLVALTKALSREIGPPRGGDILVNAVIPGPTRTRMCREGQEPEVVYPFVREAATLPAGGPNGRVFFRGRDYPFFAGFSGHSRPELPAALGRYCGASSGFGLSRAELDEFRERGYLGPFAVYEPGEMAEIRRLLEQELFSDGLGSARSPVHQVRNRHLDLPLVSRICRHPALVERVAALLGPDLLLWRTNFFIQSGMPGKGLPWHQDRYLTQLAEPRTNLSAQFAITASSPENCMVFLPGTHRLSREELCAQYALEFEEGTDDGGYGTPQFHPLDHRPRPLERIVMKPGEFVIFHQALLHKSWSVAEQPSKRIALALRVTVPEVRVLPGAFAESLPLVHRCALLRGKNTNGLNDLSDWPEE